MKGSEAIETILDCLRDEVIIACNGLISRKLFFLKDRPANFYMLGSMGLASAIGLGVALIKPDRKIVALVGDGNMLMSLGTLATIGQVSPRNLIQVVLDNECHESTGGQDTTSSAIRFALIASSCSFKNAHHVDSQKSLKSVMRGVLCLDGPSFIHVRIDTEEIELPRISIEPVRIKERFMRELAEP